MESGFRASVSAECFQHHGHSHQDHHHDDTGGDDKSAPGRHPSNVLHPVVDLDTGETGEALLADLPHGRLGVAHRVGVLDPSTGQLLAPSTSDRSDGGMEVFAASNDVFFSAFHQEFERVLGTSEPTSGAYVHEAHSHSHSHSHGHHHSHSHNELTMSQVSGITEDEEAGKYTWQYRKLFHCTSYYRRYITIVHEIFYNFFIHSLFIQFVSTLNCLQQAESLRMTSCHTSLMIPCPLFQMTCRICPA